MTTPAPVIRLHPDDGVLIARASLPPGMVVANGVTTTERIPAGHKVAIRPIAVRMVYECAQAVRIPVIGMGGIATADDAIEFLIAGASAVQVGTANFVDPFIWPKLLDGITAYLQRHRVARVADLVGTVQTPKAKAKEPSCTAS